MGTYICVHSTNSQVYLKMTKRAFLRYNYEPLSLQECLFHTTKEERNKIIWKKSVRFDTDAWYIITVCGVSTVNADTPQTVIMYQAKRTRLFHYYVQFLFVM